MYDRPLFETDDIENQGQIWNQVATQIDEGKIQSTATKTIGSINEANLMQVSREAEKRQARN